MWVVKLFIWVVPFFFAVETFFYKWITSEDNPATPTKCAFPMMAICHRASVVLHNCVPGCHCVHSHRVPTTALCITPPVTGMTRVHWTHIYKLPVLFKSLQYSLHRWVWGDSTMQRSRSHAILIATVTASLPEEQSARPFVNKADCFLLPGWTDPSQLLLDPCHSADKKIHITGREDLLSTRQPGEGWWERKKTFGCVFQPTTFNLGQVWLTPIGYQNPTLHGYVQMLFHKLPLLWEESWTGICLVTTRAMPLYQTF